MRTKSFCTAIMPLLLCAFFYNSLASQEISGAVQEKLLLPFSELRSSQNFESWNWGFALFSPKSLRNFPCQIKAGNLTAGGGISKLKNPSLSTSISPFSTGKTDASIITASLPGISSYSKPESCFAEFGFRNSRLLFSQTKINCFFNPEDKFPVLSALQALSLGKKARITLSCTAGFFAYEENSQNSWFTTNDFYYHEGRQLCLLPQISLSLPHFSALLSAASYETPFGELLPTWKSEGKLTFGRYALTGAVFYNEYDGLFSANQTTIKPQLQTKLGLQAKYAVGKKRPAFLAGGINSYTAINLHETKHKFKLATGAKVFSNLYFFSLTGAANFSCDSEEEAIKTDFESASVQFCNSWHFSKISPGWNLTLTLNPDKDYENITTSQKLGISGAFFRNPKISASTALTFTQKNGESVRQSSTTALTATWRTKYTSISGKIALKIQGE